MADNKTEELNRRAKAVIPGGVNSPVRSWKAVGGVPRFIARARGAHLVDAEGKVYLDYVGSWGALILGHADPHVVAAVQEAAARGITFGAPTEGEIQLAEMVRQRIASIEKLRLVSSGTEAGMSVLRLAKAYTKRQRIVKFDGCYHGHADALLARAGSGVATFSIPDTAGVSEAVTGETMVLSYNDVDETAATFKDHGAQIAAVIVEPVCGNMGVIPPAQGFLQTLRNLTRDHGSLLIFDEVITGFRVARGGAQEFYGVVPDLTCLGKILGGGMPLGAFGGRAEIMDLLAPDGPVYQAGTLSGNPVAVAAGIATLEALDDNGVYTALDQRAGSLQRSLEGILESYEIPATVNRVGSMATLFFGPGRVANAAGARRSDGKRFARFFHGMMDRGIYFPPSPYESAFLSLAHSDADVEKTILAVGDWARGEGRG